MLNINHTHDEESAQEVAHCMLISLEMKFVRIKKTESFLIYLNSAMIEMCIKYLEDFEPNTNEMNTRSWVDCWHKLHYLLHYSFWANTQQNGSFIRVFVIGLIRHWLYYWFLTNLTHLFMLVVCRNRVCLLWSSIYEC